MSTPSSPITITNISASGQSSGTITGITGGNPIGTTAQADYGVILIDTTSPGIFAPLGGVESSWDTASHFKYEYDVTQSVPLGRQVPISSYRRVKWRSAQREYFIADVDWYGGVPIQGSTIMDNVRLMSTSHNPVFYRDIRNISLFVVLQNFEEYVEGPVHFHFKVDMIECQPPIGMTAATFNY